MRDLTVDQQNELQRLMDNGVLLPKRLVEAAESPSSPFHNSFEWDNDRAAELYRVEQARGVIQSFTIYNEELKVRVRSFSSLNVDRENGGGYRLTTDVLKAPSLRSELIRTALKEFRSVELRYQHLTELADIFVAIDAKQAAVETISEAAVAKVKKKTRKPRTPKLSIADVKLPKRPVGRPRLQTKFAGA